jgi:hypothetical protein
MDVVHARRMQEADPFLIDHECLKRQIHEAVRTVIQERADELGLSYEACVERYFGRTTTQPAPLNN